jgi:hypothetical protein
MPLSVNFTDIEFEYIREIAVLANTSDNQASLIGRLDAFNSAQVNATQRDIEKWKAIEYGTEKSKGGIKGTDYDTQRNRDFITDKMRDRLNYPSRPASLGASDFGAFTIGLPSWSGGGEPDEFESTGDTTEW